MLELTLQYCVLLFYSINSCGVGKLVSNLLDISDDSNFSDRVRVDCIDSRPLLDLPVTQEDSQDSLSGDFCVFN